jgi:predicted permease
VAVIVDIVLPIFGLILLGYGAALFRLFDEAATRGLSLFVFNFAIPVLLIRTMSRIELPSRGDLGLLVVYFGTTFMVFALGALLARHWRRSGAEPAIFGITAAFSNSFILGIPLVLAAFGEAGMAPLSLIIAFHSVLLFTLTTLVAEMALGAGAPLRQIPLTVVRGLAGNPILIALLVGLAINIAGYELAGGLDRIARYLGDAALPCALFALGATLSRFKLVGALPAALCLTVIKNAVHPLLVLVLLPFFALSPMAAAVAITVAACPSGVNAFLFASRYKAAEVEATSTILLSTAVSIITLSLVLTWLRA